MSPLCSRQLPPLHGGSVGTRRAQRQRQRRPQAHQPPGAGGVALPAAACTQPGGGHCAAVHPRAQILAPGLASLCARARLHTPLVAHHHLLHNPGDSVHPAPPDSDCHTTELQVDWYPWGDEAFERARSEDRPIFLSVGYRCGLAGTGRLVGWRAGGLVGRRAGGPTGRLAGRLRAAWLGARWAQLGACRARRCTPARCEGAHTPGRRRSARAAPATGAT